MAASAARLEQRQHATGTAGGLTVRAAVDAFLDSPKINRSPHTCRAYANVLDRTADVLGAERDLAGVSDAELGEALTRLWGGCAESTWNRNRAAIGSWLAWCAGRQHWDAPGLPASVERRREVEDTTKAVSRSRIDRLCRRRDVPLREKTLWRMLYESASRAGAVLALNVEDLDLSNKQARVTVKGGDTMWITWGTDTAHLLPRLIAGRTPARCSCPSTAPARTGRPPSTRETSAPRPVAPGWATTGPGSFWVTTATACVYTSCTLCGHPSRRGRHRRHRDHGQDRAQEPAHPPGEQLLDLVLGRRNTQLRVDRRRRPVHLIQRTLDHHAGQVVQLDLVPQLQELEEHRQCGRPPGPGRGLGVAQDLAEVGIGIGRLHLPQRTSEPVPDQLQMVGVVADGAVGQQRRGTCQHEPGQHIGLEVGELLAVRRHPVLAQITYCSQSQLAPLRLHPG